MEQPGRGQLSQTELQSENKKLKKTVRSLLARIEDNQRIDSRFKGFEFSLLNGNRLEDVLDLLLVESRAYFDLADVGLILVDRDFSIKRLLDVLDIGSFGNRLQLRNNDDFASRLYGGDYQVVLDQPDTLTATRLFPNLKQLGSAALLPLVRNHRLIGSFHMGSADQRRFSPDKASDFINHLASVVSLCLDNSLTHEHLRRQSRVDMLTEVSNRMHFEQEFSKELERAERNDDPLSCLFVDVDHFKVINDTHGHQTGDRCLKEVAKAIGLQLRKTDLLARYGGEEFVVVLHRCDKREADNIAERIRSAVEALRVAVYGEKVVSPTVSIGQTSWVPVSERVPDLHSLGETLLKVADTALYQAKNNGRNRVVALPFSQLSQ